MISVRDHLVAALCAFAAIAWQSGAAGATSLTDFVADKAAVVKMLQDKAKYTVATAAQDRFIKDFLVSSRAYVRDTLRKKIEHQLVGVQKGLAVEEICLIGTDGHEYARVVRGEIASDLADDESEAVFFDPTWKVAESEVYVSPIYRSPDTDVWVTSYSIPVRDGDSADAMLHLEQNLGEILGRVAIRPAPQGIRWFIVADGDLMIFDSRSGVAASSGAPETRDPSRFFSKFSYDGFSLKDLAKRAGDGGVGTIDAGSRLSDVMLKAVGRWTIVAIGDRAP